MYLNIFEEKDGIHEKYFRKELQLSISQESEAIEELSASMEIIFNNTDKLAEVIEVLNKLANKFNV